MSEQGSQEWLNERGGNATASCFKFVKVKKDEAKTRKDYLKRVVAERITQKPIDGYRNAHMDRGKEQEDYAKVAYIAKFGVDINEVGFIKHPTLMAGGSPDGLIGEDGGIEIKSVIPQVQIETLKRGSIPPEHVAQVQGCMWITGRQWWDFVSFCDDMPENLRLCVYRVYRDNEYIEDLEKEVIRFLDEVDVEVANILKIGANNG